MPILTVKEAMEKEAKKKEFRETAKKFRKDYLSSLFMGLRVGGITLAVMVLLYLITKFLFRWDLFYETDLKYSTLFLLMFILFMFIVVLCFIIAIILFNTKHKRSTKYDQTNR